MEEIYNILFKNIKEEKRFSAELDSFLMFVHKREES